MTRTVQTTTGLGVSRGLAEHRSRAIHHLRYTLRLTIPPKPDMPIEADMRIEFTLADAGWPLLDFAPEHDDKRAAQGIRSFRSNGRAIPFELRDGHISVRAGPPDAGPQRLDISFRAGATGLRRRRELVYSLFVPAQAHKVFPCFDQPDLKAPMTLELEIPGEWQALANAPERKRSRVGDRLYIRFAATEPLPTYLFAFAAGRFCARRKRIGQRELEMLYPPAADSAVGGHADEIFRLHAEALDMLEDYTGIPYPFAKFGFALIPDFDFGGMEHPGAVFYRRRLLDLTPEADESDRLRRAHLIAHETAHMWFGNLVTMPWFDDVWLKEVCANFMADKIVAREFPAADHELHFLLRHLPPAYAIDRTEGTHAIREPLANLAEAGELYDALIYHKAPIAMASLEREIGESAMHRGLKRYLTHHRYSNADWNELRECLQRQTTSDLAAFSREWIETSSPRALATGLGLDGKLAYGEDDLSESERSQALRTLVTRTRARHRAIAWIRLYEDMLRGGTPPAGLLTAAVKLLETETEWLLVARLIEDLAEIYWRFLNDRHRGVAAGPVERALRLRTAREGSLHWLDTLTRFASTPESIAELASIWRGEEPGLTELSEPLSIRLTVTLALNRPDQSSDFIERQVERTQHPEPRERLRFLEPALSPDRADRDAFFDRLIAGAGRSLWAVEGLKLLNHPLRASDALHYLGPGLEHTTGLRARGDIFLPRQWLCALFHGHATPDAAAIIRRFLEDEALPTRLRRLILQTADPVFRAARIRT